jgi:SAM-dependent methyltransferase
MQKQVDANHYNFANYISKERWISFYHQLDEIISMNPGKILEIGVGSGLLRTIIKDLLHYDYESMDIDEELSPDYIGSILEMPFSDKQYDVIGCFQVLEHLPFENLEKAFSELFRVAKNAVIISLPNARRILRVNIPKICRMKMFNRPFSRLQEHNFDGEHYWEINKKGYEIDEIKKKMTEIAEKNGFILKRNYRVYEDEYRHFFIFSPM